MIIMVTLMMFTDIISSMKTEIQAMMMGMAHIVLA